MVPKGIFGPKGDDIKGDRKLYNEELHNLYFSPSIIRKARSSRIKWAGHVTRSGRSGMHVGFLWESQEREHYEDLDLDGRILGCALGCGGMDWIDLAQDRDQWRAFVNMVMNLPVP
jgi:hypothetical protein